MNETSPLEGHRENIEEWLAEGKSRRWIAAHLQSLGFDTSERSIRRAIRRWELNTGGSRKQQYGPQFEDPGMRMMGDEASVTSDPRAWKDYLNDTGSLLRERGLDPDDWEIHSLIVNEWDSPTGETLKQLKVHLKRKKILEMVVPARVSLGKVWRPRVFHITSDTEPELVVFVGDQHAPFHDPELHKRFCHFLELNAPERAVLMGDLLELSLIGRHPDEPDWPGGTQVCLDAGGQIVVDYRQASEDTAWRMLPGNHDERLRRIVIDKLADWYKLSPARVTSLPDLPPIHDPVHLLRLDELGVEYIRPEGNYKSAQYMVSPYLAAKHGERARKGSGSSAIATLENLDHSIIIGHTHRQSLVQKTVYQVDRTGRLLQAAETGCMARIEEGLGYAPQPDWSNGFATASIWPDGTFKLDLATYVDGRLYWRDERY